MPRFYVMINSNWFSRQPAYIRTFLLAMTSIAVVLLVLLLATARPAPEWAPMDSVAADTLVPAEYDEGRSHGRPPTLALRPLERNAPATQPAPGSFNWRVGVGIPDQDPRYYAWPTPRPGWYLDWTVTQAARPGFLGFGSTRTVVQPAASLGMEYTPMVRMHNGRLYPDTDQLRTLAANSPGLTWLIGNEPDVRWQDDTSPEMYAVAYHRAYSAIKTGDPSAQVAIGGISQITPLRLTYLERVWTFYQRLYGVEMPVDIWNMHAFVLREERNGWGVNIPSGFEIVRTGMLWDVDDHDDLALIEEQVRTMRRWMAAHGQQGKPLWISEYGILMPAEYGFPPARVVEFMTATFDLFERLRDPAIGYAADEDRLVQRWNWYSARDSRFAAGNLFDDTGEPTAVGAAMSAVIAEQDQ